MISNPESRQPLPQTDHPLKEPSLTDIFHLLTEIHSSILTLRQDHITLSTNQTRLEHTLLSKLDTHKNQINSQISKLQNHMQTFHTRISDMPRDVVIEITSWIHPQEAAQLRRLSRGFAETLRTPEFTRLNLRRFVERRREGSGVQSLVPTEFDRLFLRAPAAFQEAYLVHGFSGMEVISWRFQGEVRGRIPESVGGLKRLRSLEISGAGEEVPCFGIRGCIPVGVASLGLLERLKLAWNSLEGCIPPLSSLVNLTFLDLSRNLLSGPFPDVQHCIKLQSINLSHNQLSGVIPSSLCLLSNLKILYLEHNSFAGPLPIQLGLLSSLECIDLSSNLLTGGLPFTIGNLSNLIQMNVSENRLSGCIPDTVGGLESLAVLNLEGNRFSGSIPRGVGDLSRLRSLRLSRNALSGMIPPEIGNLVTLEELFLNENDFSGRLPSELRNLVNLVVLRLSKNHGLKRFGLEFDRETFLSLEEFDI